MARVLSTAFCVALLAATAGAFALTQGAKVELSPIYATSIPLKVFSPTCKCQTDTASVSFKLRQREHISVWMESGGKSAETLVAARTYRPNREITLRFTGIADDGVMLPDGGYQPVIKLPHRTFTLPNTIVIDTKAPSVVHVRHLDTHISPDSDGRNDSVHVPYVLSEKAHAILFVDGKQAVRTREQKTGTLEWGGTIHGHLLPVGAYTLSLSAEDTAGNRSKPIRFGVVTIRYVELGRSRVAVEAGARFAVLVLADAPDVQTLLDGRRRTFTTHRGQVTVKVRAPTTPGDYELYVTASGHSAKALVVVH